MIRSNRQGYPERARQTLFQNTLKLVSLPLGELAIEFIACVDFFLAVKHTNGFGANESGEDRVDISIT